MAPKIPDVPALAASGVSDTTAVYLPLADRQSTPAGKHMVLHELHKTITCTYVEDTVPADGSAVGLYSVQTGTDRGLYVSNGVEVLQVTAYSEDGDWPV